VTDDNNLKHPKLLYINVLANTVTGDSWETNKKIYGGQFRRHFHHPHFQTVPSLGFDRAGCLAWNQEKHSVSLQPTKAVK